MTTTFLKKKDNARGQLLSALLIGESSLSLVIGNGALFPASGNFVITIEYEKILISAISGDNMTIETRGYGGTDESDHPQGSNVQLNVIAEHFEEVETAINTAEGDIVTVAGDVSTVSGDLSSHSGDSGVHHHDHDHSTTGAQGGSLSTSSLVSGEVPGGTINGSNTAFTTASAYTSGSLRVFKNGIRLKGGGNDYTEVANGFTMVTAPATGTVLLVDYNTVPSVFATGSTSFIYSELCGGTPNGAITAFTTASSYVSLSTVVFLDGVRMRRGVDYTESADKEITFSSAPATGSEVLIDYQSAVSVAGNADTLDGQHGAYFMPIAHPYKAHAIIVANQTINDTTITKIQFNTEVYDNNENFDAVTNFNYTAPVTGYYQINCHCTLSDATAKFVTGSLYLYKNNSAFGQLDSTPYPGISTATAFNFNYSEVLYLTAGDTIHFAVYGDTSDNGTFVVSGTSGRENAGCSFHLLST